MEEQNCGQCGQVFTSRKQKKFCTQKCYFNFKSKTVILSCAWCNKDFEMPWARREQIYCSKGCSNSATKRNRMTLNCVQCQKEFEVVSFRKDSQFCSLGCKHKNMRSGSEEILTKQCENCKQDFEVPFAKRAKRFCNIFCSNQGEHNGMFHNAAGAQKISAARTREIVTGKRNFQSGYKSGYFESSKTPTKQFYRSSYELRALKKLDADDRVTSIQTEALRIPYTYNGEDRYYVPDILAIFKQGKSKVIEIKPNYRLEDEITRTKASFAAEFCDRLDMVYEIWDETNLD